jgi:tryptophanyl-tRNA synthetase
VMIRHVQEELAPIQDRRRAFADRGDIASEVLAEGERRATATAEATMADVRARMGLS